MRGALPARGGPSAWARQTDGGWHVLPPSAAPRDDDAEVAPPAPHLPHSHSQLNVRWGRAGDWKGR